MIERVITEDRDPLEEERPPGSKDTETTNWPPSCSDPPRPSRAILFRHGEHRRDGGIPHDRHGRILRGNTAGVSDEWAEQVTGFQDEQRSSARALSGTFTWRARRLEGERTADEDTIVVSRVAASGRAPEVDPLVFSRGANASLPSMVGS